VDLLNFWKTLQTSFPLIVCEMNEKSAIFNCFWADFDAVFDYKMASITGGIRQLAQLVQKLIP
jgi:hypothetical protein